MSQQEKQINANINDNSSSMDAEILERGDIYFFYRPKKAAEEVKGIEDVRRFFIVSAPEQEENNNNNRTIFIAKARVELNLVRVLRQDIFFGFPIFQIE
jgi:hypothetical protein